MAKIEKLWFDSERIWITTDEGQTLSRPLEAFPTLKDATEPQRLLFNIGRFGNTIRWEEIDEDIHILVKKKNHHNNSYQFLILLHKFFLLIDLPFVL